VLLGTRRLGWLIMHWTLLWMKKSNIYKVLIFYKCVHDSTFLVGFDVYLMKKQSYYYWLKHTYKTNDTIDTILHGIISICPCKSLTLKLPGPVCDMQWWVREITIHYQFNPEWVNKTVFHLTTNSYHFSQSTSVIVCELSTLKCSMSVSPDPRVG
jgi:hypothetical protein